MPKFMCASSNVSGELAAIKPKLTIAISSWAYTCAKKNIPVEFNDYTSEWMYRDSEDSAKEFITLYDRFKALDSDDLVVFMCDFGRERSRVAASVFADLFGQNTIERLYALEIKGIRQEVLRISLAVDLDGLLSEALSDRIKSVLKTRESL